MSWSNKKIYGFDDDRDQIRFGRFVMLQRIQKGWSQEDLASNSRISLKTLMRIERGEFERQPQAATLKKLGEALGMDQATILSALEFHAKAKEQGNKVSECIEGITPESIIWCLTGYFSQFGLYPSRMPAELAHHLPYEGDCLARAVKQFAERLVLAGWLVPEQDPSCCRTELSGCFYARVEASAEPAGQQIRSVPVDC